MVAVEFDGFRVHCLEPRKGRRPCGAAPLEVFAGFCRHVLNDVREARRIAAVVEKDAAPLQYGLDVDEDVDQ